MRIASLLLLLLACDDKPSDDTSVDTDAPPDTDTDTDAPPDTDTDVPPDTDGTGCPTDELALLPGTGSFAFEPLADGDAVTIVHGPQGGWHIWIGGQVTGSATTFVDVAPRVVILKDGTQLAGDQEPQRVAVASDGCGGTFYGVFAYLDDYVPAQGTLLETICRLRGQELEITVTVTDPVTSATATSVVQVVAERDPYDNAFCE